MSWLSQFVDHPWLLIISIVAALPVLWHYFKWFFGDVGGFADDAIVAGMPDWYAFFKGKYFEGEWAELKIFCFIVLCIVLVAAFYKLATLAVY